MNPCHFKVRVAEVIIWLPELLSETTVWLPAGLTRKTYSRLASWWAAVEQLYSTAHCKRHAGAPPEFWKRATPDYLVRDTGHFPLRLWDLKIIITNTTVAMWCEWIKIIPIICQIGKIIYFLVCYRTLVINLCAIRWKRLKITVVEEMFSKDINKH